MADTLLVSSSEFVTYHGGSGSYRPQAVSDALMLAESRVGTWLETFLVPTSFQEEIPWPVDDGKIMLEKAHVISITSVTAKHSLDCNCVWTTQTDCGVILNAKQGIVKVLDCTGVICNGCWPCRCPQRVVIVYQVGFSAAETDAATFTGKTIRSAVCVAALGFLRSAIGLDAAGNSEIASFSSTGYSESRRVPDLGAEEILNFHVQMAKQMLRQAQLLIKRPIGGRMRKGTNY